MVGDDTPWLTSLVGGLPTDFDYGMIRSADDARSLIFAGIVALVQSPATPCGLLGRL
jgi:hypothetical protein